MIPLETLVPVRDMMDTLSNVVCNEEATLDLLLKLVHSDLESTEKPLERLKALRYFMVYKCYSKTSNQSIYRNVMFQSLSFFKFLSDKHTVHYNLLSSIIDDCVSCINSDVKSVFASLVRFVESIWSGCKEINSCADNDIDLSQAMSALEKLCNFIIINAGKQDLRLPNQFTEEVLSLIFKLTMEQSNKLIISALPRIIQAQFCDKFVTTFWKNLENNFVESGEIDKQLFFFCHLDNFYIVLESSNHSFPLFNIPIFWEIVQNGLISDDSLHRKQALYVLKKYVDILENSSLTFEVHNFFWNREAHPQLTEYWSKMFILLEMLEEKQVHLVTPAAQLISEIYSLCSINQKVCYSWLFCVYVRLIMHSSNSVIKWGLVEFCSLDPGLLFSDSKCKVLLSYFFKSLNNMFLFNAHNKKTELNLEDSVEVWFTAVSSVQSSINVFEIVLESLANSAWGPVPLYYVTNALSKTPPTPLLNSKCLCHIQKILQETLKTQCKYIRSAIQSRLIKCLTSLAVHELDVLSVIDILGCFHGKESLFRGTGIWNTCTTWIKKVMLPEKMSEFLTMCKIALFQTDVPSKPVASFSRIMVLLNDANIFPAENENVILFDLINENFYDCEKRIYSCPEVQDKCLDFISCIIREYGKVSQPSAEKEILKLPDIIKIALPHLLKYIGFRLQRGPIETWESVTIYECLIRRILMNEFYLKSLPKEIFELFHVSINVLRAENPSIFHDFLALKIISHYYSLTLKCLSNEKVPLSEKDVIHLIFQMRLLNKNYIPSFSASSKGRIASQLLEISWIIVSQHAETDQQSLTSFIDVFSISMLMNAVSNSICEDGRQTLIPALKFASFLLPHVTDAVTGRNLIITSWNACFDLRKNELFWPSITAWIVMVFQKGIADNPIFQDLTFDFAKQIIELGNDLIGLVDLLIDQYFKSKIIFPNLSFVISRIITFGPLIRKDIRIENEVCSYIIKLQENGLIESFGTYRAIRNDRETKLKPLKLLFALDNGDSKNRLVANVIEELISFDAELSKNNKRYFNDSLTHRKKHRLLQALLVLENYIFQYQGSYFEKLPKILFDWVLESILGTNQQPSVRYQLEWLFIRLTLHFPSFLNKFWVIFEQVANERLGSICSFISIAYHLCSALNDNVFLENCIENIIPWCMSQNFNIRLYSQVVLSKLWDMNPSMSKKYNCIKQNQWKIYEQQGNVLANAQKLLSDFYFEAFNPNKHFTLKTIYWDLPRLSNISSEEWLHPDILKMYSETIAFPDLLDAKNLLDTYTSPAWISKVSANRDSETEVSCIQKKFIPWKGMFSQHEEKDKIKGGLILVASLVEKAANLGGLARTCEVFSAKELVLSNLDISNSKEFTSLSMTAEKHLEITEVKPHSLPAYLKMMKSMGYMLVGAEQTTGSLSLVQYTFEKDCILLLGNEREGIPANLLPLVDVCIEIPQLGLVRSLNVHVSGALLLWEYSKQHSLKKTN